MNKKELMQHIYRILCETELNIANATELVDEMYYLGVHRGLEWARNFIIDLEDKHEN